MAEEAGQDQLPELMAVGADCSGQPSVEHVQPAAFGGLTGGHGSGWQEAEVHEAEKAVKPLPVKQAAAAGLES